MLTMQQALDMRQGVTLSGDRNQCSECGLLFNSSGAFDKHRIGRSGVSEGPDARRCMTQTEMRFYGMSKSNAGFWVKAVMTEEERERTRGTPSETDSEQYVGGKTASGNPVQVLP